MYCMAYIQGVTPSGGRVVSMLRGAVWTGRGDFVQETQSLANQNCLARGFTGVHLSAPVRLPDLMVYRQVQEFTCIKRPLPSSVPVQESPVAPYQTDRSSEKVPTIPPAVPLEKAREKCRDLGFKERTEAFGTCVLKLSK